MVKSRLNIVSGFAVLALSCGLVAKDAAVQVGWVTQQIVGESKYGKELEAKVSKQHRELAKTVEEKQKAYMDAAGKLNASAAAMSPEARETEAEKVNDLKLAYEKAARNAEQTMQRKMQEATQEAIKCFTVAAEEYAKKHGFDVLLSEAGVVYVSQEVNQASKEVCSIMDRNHEMKLADSKKADKAEAPKMAAAPKADTKKVAKAPAAKAEKKAATS